MSFSKLDKMECSQIDLVVEEVNNRWKKLSVEMKSVKSMLEEVVGCWKRYNAYVDILTAWLADGEQAMAGSLEDKEVRKEWERSLYSHLLD